MNAPKDQNGISGMLGILNTDGSTIVPIQANPTTHAINVSDGTTGTDHGPSDAIKDGNYVPVLMAVSSVDGKTPVVIYADSSGNLLIQST